MIKVLLGDKKMATTTDKKAAWNPFSFIYSADIQAALSTSSIGIFFPPF